VSPSSTSHPTTSNGGFEKSAKIARNMAKFSDGSVILEVVDPQNNTVQYMRQFPNGDMIPVDQEY
jgi:hypothetical protein